jgi:hypothetical protein
MTDSISRNKLPHTWPIYGHHKAKRDKSKVSSFHSESLKMEASSVERSREVRDLQKSPLNKLKRLISRIGHAVKRVFDKLLGVRRDVANVSDECATPSGKPVDWESTEAVSFDKLVLAKDKKKLKADVDNAMLKIQKKIVKGKSAFSEQLRSSLAGETGRDRFFYAPIKGHYKDLLELLQSWDAKKWSVEASAGLLIDISRTVKDDTGETTKNLLNPQLMKVRGPKGEHKINLQATWVEDLEKFGVDKKKGLKTGPSMSTAIVLRFLRRMKETSDEETEAIANALVLYWKNSIKHMRGEYHTTVEVWAAYTRHLEKVNRRRRREAEEL